ncbi:flagellar basal body rod protein FlgC [Virgisporangium aurantiacum]|uniref:Flagellar basal-body rod protein FlgC n=1 Tax=Virgisporangium aurantiacum TaxID=175570 RepID=A0A8J4DVK4_9ACTN|nr:flagellar basal body rod C-terminal domain-containing protein [Virgisporangium aurantiacum]GIJ52510.1 flagellar basal-body rod protein FlgC [Virgisporangium aurantiacum]
MSGIFGALGIAGTGLTVHRKWLDAASDNIANINNVTSTSNDAFQARYILAQAVDYGRGTEGVQVGGAALSGKREGKTVYEPDHPLADERGNVRYPDINLGDQMGNLIMAQRGYQANLAVVDRAREAYQSALQLGKG